MTQPSETKAQRRSPMTVGVVLMLSALFGYLVLPRLSGSGLTQSPLTGTPAPGFSLPVLGEAEQRVSLEALRGQVVVLDFWASWCRPCAAQSRILTELAQEWGARGPSIVAINTSDDPEAAMRYVEQHGFPYPAVLDTEGIAAQYAAHSLPTLVVVDASGRISWATSGVVAKKHLLRAVQEAADSSP